MNKKNLRAFAIVTPGLENTASDELQELCQLSCEVSAQLLSFPCSGQELFFIARYSHAIRRLLLALGSSTEPADLVLDETLLSSLFSTGRTYKIEVENVKGQENRTAIAKVVAGKLLQVLAEQNGSATIDYKKPDVVVIVHKNEAGYFAGIDLCRYELNARAYRVFAHPASFKGDLAFHLVKLSGFTPGNRLLVGFAKDGTTAIEAALYANNLPVNNAVQQLQQFPFLQNIALPEVKQPQPTKIYGFDSSLQNINAARKNAQLAGVRELTEIQKYSLEELDVKYDEHFFDQIILYITQKDEDKINEIYYQTRFLLKPGGILLLLCRQSWDFSVSDRFLLVEKKEIQRGAGVSIAWILRKKAEGK